MNSEGSLTPVPEVDKISFFEEEEKVYKHWKDIDVFHSCLKQSKDRPRFTFYDGPPFATGLPHYGHILAGTIKDVITRWAHQTGHHVERRFGWDTHGLPVEYEIDKTHNIKGSDDVLAMGIKNYNDLCRSIVMRYASDWERIISRLGRWIDFRNDYKTMYPWYMESIWWVFSQLFDKGLVYRGVKVMPFSSGCSTPLSNFEAGQNYKDTQDPSIVVSFPLLNSPEVSFVAWTTTPWTLPSNLALCVNPNMDYVKVQGKSKECSGIYIMMEARLCQLFKDESQYEIIAKMKGKNLEGTEFVPIFNYFEQMKAQGAFRVVADEYVTSESGTGVVQQAPYFGEDDYRVCLHYGLITKEQKPICPVDDCGRFTAEVTDFAGMYVKDADAEILKALKSKGRLIQSLRLNHSYPFCWRSDTPLLYKAVPSWFVRVKHMQDSLLSANQKTYWVPNFVKEKRFGNWLRDARDWAISRNRYWGTPIPLWVSEDFEEVVCIGSIAELQRLSGQKVTDLHRENIDPITIPSVNPNNPPLRRITEVFDCWFESGSMPYAQVHYPFENKRAFEDCFPADFIAEGIDQTRGWFYTLLVISTSLFGSAPFKNLIANGLILAADGQKMSKRKKNYPDPVLMVEKYGADALRLYLVNSPCVRGENLRFKEEDVFGLLKEVFIPWLNAYRFFVQQVQRFEKEENEKFLFDEKCIGNSSNVMDCWILSFTQSLLDFVHKEMKAYRLYTVTPRLIKFVDNLTNWFIRFNRKRLKGETGKEDCLRAVETLFAVLFSMVRVMAPFTPFITDMMYGNLKKVIKSEDEDKTNMASVHYLMVPRPIESLICPPIETSVATLQSVVELGRYIRDKVNCPMKYPLPEVIVIHKDQAMLEDVLLLEGYIKEELNVRHVTTSTDKEKYGVVLKADINFKLLGLRLKGDVKRVQKEVALLTDEMIEGFLKNGSIDILGHEITSEELLVKYAFDEDNKMQQHSGKYEAHSDAQVLVLLETTPSQEMLDEGLAREVVNRVQKLRKKAQLVPTDEITLWHSVQPDNTDVARVTRQFKEYIENAIKTQFLPLNEMANSGKPVIIEEKANIKDTDLILVITKGFASAGNALDSLISSQGNEVTPICPWVNLVYQESCNKTYFATLLLQNPVGKVVVNTLDDLVHEAMRLFHYKNDKVFVYVNGKCTNRMEHLNGFSGQTIVLTCNQIAKQIQPSIHPYCRFINVNCGQTNKGTVLLENPQGTELMKSKHFNAALKNIFKVTQSNTVYSDESKNTPFSFRNFRDTECNKSCNVYT